MTLTLNENEVAINYIKYDSLRCFFGATLWQRRSSFFLNVIGKCVCMRNLPVPLNLISVHWFGWQRQGEMTVRGRRRNEHLRTLRHCCTKQHKKVADYEKYTTWTVNIHDLMQYFTETQTQKKKNDPEYFLWLKTTSHSWGFQLAVIPLVAAVWDSTWRTVFWHEI